MKVTELTVRRGEPTLHANARTLARLSVDRVTVDVAVPRGAIAVGALVEGLLALLLRAGLAVL